MQEGGATLTPKRTVQNLYTAKAGMQGGGMEG